MSDMFMTRAGRCPAHQAACSQCDGTVSVRLLWTLRTQGSNDPCRPTLWCSACLTLAAWREMAESAAPSPEPASGRPPACDRCMRRSRPTQELFGFHLCQECMGRGDA